MYGADPQLHLSGSAIHLITEAFDVVQGIDNQNGVGCHLPLHSREQGASSRFLGPRILQGCQFEAALGAECGCPPS